MGAERRAVTHPAREGRVDGIQAGVEVLRPRRPSAAHGALDAATCGPAEPVPLVFLRRAAGRRAAQPADRPGEAARPVDGPVAERIADTAAQGADSVDTLDIASAAHRLAEGDGVGIEIVREGDIRLDAGHPAAADHPAVAGDQAACEIAVGARDGGDAGIHDDRPSRAAAVAGEATHIKALAIEPPGRPLVGAGPRGRREGKDEAEAADGHKAREQTHQSTWTTDSPARVT